MAVPAEVMQHIVNVESGYNPFAIGVVGAQLERQPKNLGEAVATVQMLETKGYNFSVGLSQVNRTNLSKYGLSNYQQAFDICPNLVAGARILSDCYANSGNDWGKSFSCYYSGNFVTGYRDGYVQKIYASISAADAFASVRAASKAKPIQLVIGPSPSLMHGATMVSASAVAIPDSASYRLAIRTAALDTVGTTILKSLDPASARTPGAQKAPTQSRHDTPEERIEFAGTSQTAPTSPSVNAAAPSVFVPKITVLGAPTQQLSTETHTSLPNAASFSPPSTDANQHADPGQGAHDDAFVF